MHSRVSLAVVLLVLLVVLAGCLGGVSPGSTDTVGTTDAGTAEPTDTATVRPTTTATPFPDETVPFPAGPKSRPDRPEDLTAESAAAFVTRHEFRYSYNQLWAGEGTEVGMSEHSCHVESTEPRGDGYVVVVECSGYVNEPASGDTTRTRHADLPPWTVRYYVDEDSLLREELS